MKAWPKEPRIALFSAMLCLLAGLGIAVFMRGVEGMWYPAWLGMPVQALSRLCFALSAPVQLILYSAAGERAHHPDPLLLSSAYVLTPVFWAGLAGLVFLARAARHAVFKQPGKNEPSSPSRRMFLSQGAAGAVAAGGAALGGDAVLFAPQRLEVRRYDLPVRGLPTAFDGYRVAHLSDTHFGVFIKEPYLNYVISRVNELEPDLCALTGDYVHRTANAIPDGIGLLGGLRARHGSVATLGNHDHWEGAEACREHFARIGVRMLDNDRCFLTDEGLRPELPAHGEAIALAGLDDEWEGMPNLARALRDIPPEMPRIVLAHNPDSAFRVRKSQRVDAMLSGHTHGGQVVVPGYGPPLLPVDHRAFAGGWCEGPGFPVIVSRGAGMAMLPIRFNCPPEVGLITLRKA